MAGWRGSWGQPTGALVWWAMGITHMTREGLTFSLGPDCNYFLMLSQHNNTVLSVEDTGTHALCYIVRCISPHLLYAPKDDHGTATCHERCCAMIISWP